jgi:hypothetical protein
MKQKRKKNICRVFEHTLTRYSYWGKLWRREVVDNTDPALQPLIPMEQEPASVAPPEHGMEWWSNLWKMSFLNHSLKYLLCHILLLLMKLNNLLHFVELVGKLGLLVNGGRSDILLQLLNLMNLEMTLRKRVCMYVCHMRSGPCVCIPMKNIRHKVVNAKSSTQYLPDQQIL